MKKYLWLTILLINIIPNFLVAQEKLPRFYWAEMYDTLEVTQNAMIEMRQAIDSIDFTTVSDEELEYLERYLEPYQKKWMAIYGNLIPKGNPATTFIVGGMDCDKCEEIIRAEIEAVEGVTKVQSIDREENEVIFEFKGEPQTMVEKVISTLKENLMGCGYFFYEYHLIESDELKEEFENLEILKQALGEECDKHE